MADLIESPPPRKGFIINRENAREMAARGNAAKARRLQELRDAAKPPPPNPNDPFTLRRLARVRGQLDKLDGMIEHELDPQKLDRLASAQLRLSEQERILDGRPLPGSRRPSAEPKGSAQDAGAWIMDAPAAALPAAPTRPLGWEYIDPNAPACGADTPTGSVLEQPAQPATPQEPPKP